LPQPALYLPFPLIFFLASFFLLPLSADDEYSGYHKVGRRRRERQRKEGSYGARGSSGGKVPRERALVPVGVASRPWQQRSQ
jgi:hypothetical protein